MWVRLCGQAELVVRELERTWAVHRTRVAASQMQQARCKCLTHAPCHLKVQWSMPDVCGLGRYRHLSASVPRPA